MTQHVLLDSQGNVVDTSDEPFVSDVPSSGVLIEKPQISSAPEPTPTMELPEYSDQEQTTNETAGLGQGILAGIDEANVVNPIGGIFTPATAFLLSTFYDRNTPYSEIKRRLESRQKARSDISKATEGDVYRGFRETTQKTGEALKPIEEIMMGQALLSGIAKTARGAQALQALSKVPGTKAAGTVLSKTVGSRNPLVRAGSLAGATGAGTAAYDIAKGENAATTIADSLSNAASIGLPVLGAGYLPASVFYPTMMTASAGKGYVARKGKGQETDFSDVLGDLVGGAAYGKLLRGEIIPEDTAVEKGSKAAKAVDTLKSVNKIDTKYVEENAAKLGYSDDTPFWKVPLKKADDFFEHFRKIDSTKASTFGHDVIKPLRLDTERKLKTVLNKEQPLVRETKTAQKGQSKLLGDPAGLRDKAALRNHDKRPININRIDKNLPKGTQARQDFEREYFKQGGQMIETENGVFYQRTPTYRAMKALGSGDPIQVEAADGLKKTLAYTKKGYKDWQRVDNPSHKSIVTVGEMKEAGTPQSDAYKAKNAIWNNEVADYPEELQVTGVGKDTALSPEAHKLIKEYDHLVDAEKTLSAELGAAPKKPVAEAAAATVMGGRLAKYGASVKVAESLKKAVGRLGTREAAEMLSKMTVGDFKNLLRAKWGSSVPFVETISAVKNLPKRKEKRK